MSNFTGARVLIVDDLDSNILAMQAALESLPLQVVGVRSGQEALHAVLLEDFALILLDVHLPALDGIQTARLLRLRERSKHVPIIFVTAAHDSPEFMTRGYSVGAVDYLVKPLDPYVLRAKVEVFVQLQLKSKLLQKQAEQLRRVGELKLGELRRQSDERHSALLATLSHDLRTPLNAVLGWSHILKSGDLDNAGRVQAVETIGRNAQSLARLAADLVNVSSDMSLLPVPHTAQQCSTSLAGIYALVVEDDPDSSELVEVVLRRFGADVTCVATVSAALCALAARRPDVLVSDIGLPDEDGLTLIRRVRRTQELVGLPAIALSAYASRNDVRQALDAGFQAHVAKPVEPSQLGKIIANVIGG